MFTFTLAELLRLLAGVSVVFFAIGEVVGYWRGAMHHDHKKGHR